MKENSYEFKLKVARTPPQETMKSRNTDLLLTSHSDPLPKLVNNDISKQNQPTTKLINFRIFFIFFIGKSKAKTKPNNPNISHSYN
jgi:hypothetical protein